jgi:hypothetical protein
MSRHHRDTKDALSRHIMALRSEIDTSNAVLVDALLDAALEQTIRLERPDRRTRRGKQLDAIRNNVAALRCLMNDYCTEYHIERK